MRRLRFHPCGNYKESYAEELTVFETDFGRFCLLAGLVLLFGVLPFISSPYFLYVCNMIGIAAIAALGLNILIGYTGLISLGHGAFFGVGAYAAAILATRLGLPFLVCVPAAGLVAAFAGMIFGIPSGRLKGLYLTIATLAGQFIIEYILIHWESLTQGTMGIVLPQAAIFGLAIEGDRPFFYVIFTCLALITWMTKNIMRTRYGRAFIAIRDNDRAAEGMGIPIFPYKLLSFGISSFYAGFAGAIWAFYMISITSEPFTLSLSVEYIAMVIIGGLGSIPGAIFGAVFITGLNEILRWFTDMFMNIGLSAGFGLNLAAFRELAFGLAIVLFILFEPKGLAEVWRIVRSNFRLWPFSY
ncbi:MAG: leucine/isoleucine/valine transporter permease subunit [Deltaproteobacteria bacterium ADurb.BinA179]|jgi:branched-chain amino acid transport system permease protein|nr:branched-chain amino acid ABC transporter permease [Deltaproteobacteria bacterium]MDI9541913.1 branched-chain amino acid ABC transporter permease [Pseudomonadota bacterium]NLW67345.1 branched-chain amino acid ABC transporter permease [Bacteriovoracaceae bacterium]OPZ27345.1 MAG: leucine/isoleucine/valine transporter permease subunit [Deltaproteobacteria bacterium ADurb.BinA179]HRR22131.1 branched-chain amino acid ABC transporter permease [Desulfomonilia bacterium]